MGKNGIFFVVLKLISCKTKPLGLDKKFHSVRTFAHILNCAFSEIALALF